MLNPVLWLTLLSFSCFTSSLVWAATDTYFTAAVFEFTQIHKCHDDVEKAKEVVRTNLDVFVQVGKLAKEKDADIIVFPEYGIFPDCWQDSLKDRVETKLFLEDIPDPIEQYVNPCENPAEYADRPQLFTLSCIAKNNSIFLQANSGDIKECEGELGCPMDGHHQFNTNLVFDRNGTLLVRYHKEHLWGEVGMDIAGKIQTPIFKTDFGVFATYVCFDIMLARIVEVIEEPQVDGVVFSTMWENTVPLFSSVNFFQAWVMGNNVTLLAADIQLPGELSVGSGIFHGQEGALAYTFDPDGISKLVVARVPKKGYPLTEPKSSITAILMNGTTFPWKMDGDNVPARGPMSWGTPENELVEIRYREMDLKDYTLVKLTSPSGHLEACHNGLCCFLDYFADEITEDYFLAVLNGTQSSFDPVTWCEEDCVIIRCEPKDGRPCATYPLWANDRFHYVSIQSNFTTPFIYPTVVSNHSRLIPVNDWDLDVQMQPYGFDARMHLLDEEGKGLLSFGMIGRCYLRDPPFSFF